ncbi:capsule biosynthesis protein [Fertoebacter nigrum]|uniref:Capsule biosynthesis protein n=2 Tax=Fertoeibacter niger TaxID=2656921 RepID=A0A8X8H4Z9_9RHOB|nr:capsule biosynthesis protein [Fertoeibacter niger]NUB46499.1 capsule biosynthesis protein [Fertoeibacter niger]
MARLKRRHHLVFLSFLACVLLPGLVSGFYLWTRAADQYASTVAFSVRKEEVSSAIELLGGITELSGSSSSDTDILYEFIQSQKLVSEIDAEIDLRGIWSKPQGDPIFAYEAPGTIEDLAAHWDRMVRIYYDSATSLIEVRALAFTPDDATAIAEAVYRRSSAMINALSDIAREDSLRYSREELDRSVELVKTARNAVTAFRNRNQMVDPTIDLQAQAGLLGNLQSQLAEALIEVDVLDETTRVGDPRMEQALRRVRVIEDRIESERRKMGIGDQAQQGQVYADLVGEYERLVVDREFAERSYTAALAAHDAAMAEAQRQSRYLAAHVLPTEAEKSQYPQRGMLLGLIMLFAFLIWGIAVLVVYSLKDRR